MTEMLTCSACGRTAWDVSSRVVELAEPRMVHDPHSDQPVREVYGVEPRCSDPRECHDRTEAIA